MPSKENSSSSKLDIDGDAIRELAALMEETGLTEIEVAEGERRLRVSKAQQIVAASPLAAYAQPSGLADAAGSGRVDAAPQAGTTVTSPLVGTAYLRPDPSSAPFVKAGDEVSAGDTLLIIEAMKVMNPIKAERAGRVVRIIVSDSQPVEFGEALMIVE